MAKSFVMQLAALVTLFVSLPAFISLIFGIINLQFPDAVDNYWEVESAEAAIRYSIAVLVIFFPAYLLLTRKVNQSRRQEGELYHKLTKWIIYLALLVAGMIMLGDLAVVVYTFLNGEITVRFILKSLALLAVIGAASYYYVLDAQNYWQDREKQSLQIGFVAMFVVAVFVVIGFLNIDAPSVAREVRIDQEQIYDLQDIQWRVEAFYQESSSFPASIEMLYEDVPAPQPAEGREAYELRPTGPDSYVLCATFAYATPAAERNIAKPIGMGEDVYLQNQNWEHGAGRKCYERKIVLPTEV